MAVTTKSARLFLERAEIRETKRAPMPTIEISANRVHNIPLEAPLPWPSFAQHKQGDPPPDRGATTDWPHGKVGD